MKKSAGGDMDAAISFLRELSDNNNRPWFKARKPVYDELRRHWIMRIGEMIAAMAQWDSSLAAMSPERAVYRIYRDTRFSLDKTPYKTHLAASVYAPGQHSHLGYYIELNPKEGESGLYGGIWAPEPQVLAKLRHAIADNSEEWLEIVNEPELNRLFPGWYGQTLKTIPKGWDRNHPMAEYLRLKDIGKLHRLDNDFFSSPDWPSRAAEIFAVLKPLNDFLDYSIREEL